MFTFHRFSAGLGVGLGGLLVCAGCAAQVNANTDDADVATAAAVAQPNDSPTCRLVAGQAEIDGVMQPVTGRACLQPDGSWQIVEGDEGAQALAPAPVYYYDPWFWGPPVAFVGGVSFVFVDRFHHFHRMDHVRYSRGSYGMGIGGHGGWHGAGAMPHGGGGMHR
ncbi:hypothetical protein PQQ51_25080 [Paraburkholderia xenovorans]|uniref:hypothetical protein n=1 Tax=Paraburkholderia xenovorans TaxID=36873 RepID=UPI0038BB3E48